MSEEYATLLRNLASVADDSGAVRSQLADATALRPQALQEVERAVDAALQSGQLPEDTAHKLLTRVREVAAATRLRADTTARPRTVLEMGEGTVLKDRFVLKREIGRGGMGAVFAAEDRRKVEADDPEPMVAVKVLQPALAGHPAAFIALQRESRRAQELAHPNIATVYDFDREGELVFMTMELLRGAPLDAMIRDNDLGMERRKAMAIVRGVAQGLAYAHRKGLVHADLKPSNIFLTEEQQPKVLDFGIARAVPGAARTGKDKFDAGELGAYTEAYATDEMVQGSDPHPADDIYALGLIAYELLTGRHPYQRLGAAEAQKRGLKPRPIAGLPRREWSVIERSLAFTRARRPADAAAFLRALTGLGTTQKALIAATAVLALLAGYFGYARYQATGPAVAFASLPAATQAAFQEKMRVGNEDWQSYLSGNAFDWQAALQSYAEAYDIHPRNRQATRALRELARRVLEDHPDAAQAAAQLMVEVSPGYLASYGPVKAAASAP